MIRWSWPRFVVGKGQRGNGTDPPPPIQSPPPLSTLQTPVPPQAPPPDPPSLIFVKALQAPQYILEGIL